MKEKENSQLDYSFANEFSITNANISYYYDKYLKKFKDSIKNGDFKEAITACKEAIEINPKDASAYNNLGNALRHDEQYKEAIEAYKEAIKLRPGYEKYQLQKDKAEQGLIDVQKAQQIDCVDESHYEIHQHSLGKIEEVKPLGEETMTAHGEYGE